MSADQLLFLLAFAATLIKIECSFQHMSWRTWPPRWVADLILMLACAAGAREILTNAWRPGWIVTMLAIGVAMMFAFERRWPANCAPKKPASHHSV